VLQRGDLLQHCCQLIAIRDQCSKFIGNTISLMRKVPYRTFLIGLIEERSSAAGRNWVVQLCKRPHHHRSRIFFDQSLRKTPTCESRNPIFTLKSPELTGFYCSLPTTSFLFISRNFCSIGITSLVLAEQTPALKSQDQEPASRSGDSCVPSICDRNPSAHNQPKA